MNELETIVIDIIADDDVQIETAEVERIYQDAEYPDLLSIYNLSKI